jgi:hypothetical protein
MKRFIILSLVFFGCVSLAQALTLSELRARERYKLNDSTSVTNSPTWSDAELNTRNNDVQRNIAQYTRCIYAQYLTTPTAEVREYAKPTNCITIDRVSMINVSSTSASNQFKKLTAITLGGLDRDFPTWESYTSGLPTKYYERGNYIGFERPVSATYCSTGSIKVDYYKYPADMTSDSDEPFDSLDYLELYHDIIVLGVVIKCKQDEGKGAEAQTLQGEYVSQINLMIESLNFLPDQRVQKIKIGD